MKLITTVAKATRPKSSGTSRRAKTAVATNWIKMRIGWAMIATIPPLALDDLHPELLQTRQHVFVALGGLLCHLVAHLGLVR